jgi:hypothetical protein
VKFQTRREDAQQGVFLEVVSFQLLGAQGAAENLALVEVTKATSMLPNSISNHCCKTLIS